MAEEREPKGDGRPSRAIGAGGVPRAKTGRSRKRIEPAPTTPDPIEIAMEAEASGVAPEGVARRVLLKQEALIGWQIASERAGVVVRLLTAAAGLAVALALGLMAWDAHQARGVVFEPFAAAPTLAAQGVTGQVAAARMLDQLRRLQADTSLGTRREQSADHWSSQTRVEIPNTGVSITELEALLHGWLGHEKHVTAELSGNASRLTLTVRTGTAPGERFDGAPDQLDALIARGAEAVYRAARPEQFAQYLMQHARRPEGLAIYERLSLQGARPERARALADWGAELEDPKQALVKLRQAVALDPDFPFAWSVIAYREQTLFHSEAALTASRRALALWNGPRARDFTPGFVSGSRDTLESMIAALLGDPMGWARAAERASAPDPDVTLTSCRDCVGFYLRLAATGYAAAGDGAGMRRLLNLAEATAPSPQNDAISRLTCDLNLKRADEDWPALNAAFDDPAIRAQAIAAGLGVYASDYFAHALAHSGRVAEGAAVNGATPGDCYMCVVTRGVAASQARDWRAADAAFARAVAMGPSLPQAHLERGVSLLQRRDVEAAITEFTTADRLSPHYGAPQIAWGEALLTRGEAKAAIAHFAKAEPNLPRLGHLHLKWGEALAKLGKADEARAKWAAASGMDLSAADRARLAALIAGRTA